jgi:hypothetical protein
MDDNSNDSLSPLLDVPMVTTLRETARTVAAAWIAAVRYARQNPEKTTFQLEGTTLQEITALTLDVVAEHDAIAQRSSIPDGDLQ